MMVFSLARADVLFAFCLCYGVIVHAITIANGMGQNQIYV